MTEVTFLLAEVGMAAATILCPLSPSAAAITFILELGVLAFLCEKAGLRFGWRRLDLKTYLYLLLATIPGNLVLSAPAPNWFPTNDSEWVFVPAAIFGFASLRRGWMRQHVTKT